MRVVFAHAHFLHFCIMLHIAHVMASERIIVHSRLHSAFSAFGGQLHFCCISAFFGQLHFSCICGGKLHLVAWIFTDTRPPLRVHLILQKDNDVPPRAVLAVSVDYNLVLRAQPQREHQCGSSARSPS